MAQALTGLRVLDLTHGPAGGMATMVLADFGAEVLLVERPGVTHPLDELPAARMWRRGKQTVGLDLADEQDMATFHELAAGADVLVCNWRPAALARKGLDFERLHQRHPHLVYCHITGFGARGPLAESPSRSAVATATPMHTDKSGRVAAARLEELDGVLAGPLRRLSSLDAASVGASLEHAVGLGLRVRRALDGTDA